MAGAVETTLSLSQSKRQALPAMAAFPVDMLPILVKALYNQQLSSVKMPLENDIDIVR
jgi:hypothetical protein